MSRLAATTRRMTTEYFVGTFGIGSKEHATKEVVLEEYGGDGSDVNTSVTLCGIWNPIIWRFFWYRTGPLVCLRCKRIYESLDAPA